MIFDFTSLKLGLQIGIFGIIAQGLEFPEIALQNCKSDMTTPLSLEDFWTGHENNFEFIDQLLKSQFSYVQVENFFKWLCKSFKKNYFIQSVNVISCSVWNFVFPCPKSEFYEIFYENK